MTDQHWAIAALIDIRTALPVQSHWVAREHITDAIEAIRAVTGETPIAETHPGPGVTGIYC